MKGMIFTEFLDMVEDRFGLEMAERLIEASGSPTHGAYTSVGTYDHHEMVRMIDALAGASGIPAAALSRAYGQHLFAYFVRNYPQMFAGLHSTFDFLRKLDGYIHVEVRKLYADAELPRFEIAEVPGNEVIEMTYRSSRSLADLAEGLIEGCAAYYREKVSIARADLSDGQGTVVRFYLQKAP